MSNIDTALILAGGLGSRLRPLVADRPKPMALVCGRPFLEYTLSYLVKRGIKKLVLSLGYKGAHVQQYFGSKFHDVPIEYVIESQPLGTGGAVLSCLKTGLLPNSFFVINGDTFYDVDLAAMAQFYFRKRANWVIAVFEHYDNSRYLTFGMEKTNNRLHPLNDRFDKSWWVNGGTYIVNAEFLEDLGVAQTPPTSLENELLCDAMASNHQIFGFPSDGFFIDIGLPADYLRAQNIFSKVDLI